MSDELSQYDEAYREAELPDTDGGDYSEPVPDGTYQARVKEVKLARSKDQVPMLKWCFEITGGNRAFVKRWLWKNHVIQENTLPWIKKDLATLGLKLARFSTLPSQLPRLAGKLVEIAKKTNGQYSNVYINKLVKAKAEKLPEPEDEGGQASETETEDVPF